MPKSGAARLTGAQLRAARALLNLTADALAVETKIGLRTIGRAESDHGPVRLTAANADRIVQALEARGVIFLWEAKEGAGVRLRQSPPPNFGNDGNRT